MPGNRQAAWLRHLSFELLPGGGDVSLEAPNRAQAIQIVDGRMLLPSDILFPEAIFSALQDGNR